MPRFSSRELAFLLFRATVLHSCRTSFTSGIYDANPRLSRAAVHRQELKVNELLSVCGLKPAGWGWDSPLMTCSGEMVFLSDLLHISLASEEMRWMNSVQQLTTSSLASLATRTFGRVSLIILLMAALGMVRSSSVPEDEAIVARKIHTNADTKPVTEISICRMKAGLFVSDYRASNMRRLLEVSRWATRCSSKRNQRLVSVESSMKRKAQVSKTSLHHTENETLPGLLFGSGGVRVASQNEK